MTNWVYTKGLHKLTEGVYTYLQPPGALGGSNAGLIVDGGESLLVDTFYDLNLTGQLLRAVREIPGAEPIKYLVNTHVDGDHIFGNQLVEGAEIISTRACAEELSRDLTPQDYVELIKSAPQMGKAGQYIQMTLGQLDFEGIHLTPPTRTFEGRLDLKIGEKEINLIQVGPAHTEGDLVVYIPGDRVLFSGDVVCTSITPPSWHGTSTNLIKAMDTILALDLDILVPGHGQITDRSSAQLMKDYWEYTTETARNLYDRSVPVLDAGLELGANGKFSHLPLPAVNIINCHMLYREFSGREEPLDKFVIMAQIAETLIPD